jgi:hypothetical protein
MSNEENDRIRRIIKSEEETQGVYNPTPPAFSRPALDKDNMPLPRRVDEIDVEGTRVTRAAYEPTSKQVPPQLPKYLPPTEPNTTPRIPFYRRRGTMGCFLRGMIASVFALLVIGLLMGSYFVYRYYLIASTLPDVGTLRDRASQFQTTRILDRNGQLLYELLDPTAGRRNYIPLEKISPNLIAATIATEDKEFYTNPGFDPIAIVRALWQNYVTSGQGAASTITQQWHARFCSPEERSQRTVNRKARDHPLLKLHAAMPGRDPGTLSQRDLLWQPGLWRGSCRGNLLRQIGKRVDTWRGAFLAELPQSPAV